jgi:hypothetical protein
MATATRSKAKGKAIKVKAAAATLRPANNSAYKTDVAGFDMTKVQELGAIAFYDSADDMFDAVMTQIRWHHDQIRMTLGIFDGNDDPKSLLLEMRGDLVAALALTSLLFESSNFARG